MSGPLLNLKELSKKLGVKYYFCLGMKNAGMVMPGRRITEADARKWLAENPGFVPSKGAVIEAPEFSD